MTDMPNSFDVQEHVTQRQWLERSHLFRSRLIERCAQVERWAMQTAAAISTANSASAKSSSPLLGQKIELVRELARKHPDHFASPAKVIDRLDQFQPYADLRNELAHATTSVELLANCGAMVHFRNAGHYHLLIDRSIVLTSAAMQKITQDLDKLCNQIQQLTVKSAQ